MFHSSCSIHRSIVDTLRTTETHAACERSGGIAAARRFPRRGQPTPLQQARGHERRASLQARRRWLPPPPSTNAVVVLRTPRDRGGECFWVSSQVVATLHGSAATRRHDRLEEGKMASSVRAAPSVSAASHVCLHVPVAPAVSCLSLLPEGVGPQDDGTTGSARALLRPPAREHHASTSDRWVFPTLHMTHSTTHRSLHLFKPMMRSRQYSAAIFAVTRK
ncbi:hypothetical protein MTO96_028548 [Rhipicephalus appendiculatus]